MKSLHSLPRPALLCTSSSALSHFKLSNLQSFYHKLFGDLSSRARYYLTLYICKEREKMGDMYNFLYVRMGYLPFFSVLFSFHRAGGGGTVSVFTVDT